jgi:hypothetical protein
MWPRRSGRDGNVKEWLAPNIEIKGIAEVLKYGAMGIHPFFFSIISYFDFRVPPVVVPSLSFFHLRTLFQSCSPKPPSLLLLLLLVSTYSPMQPLSPTHLYTAVLAGPCVRHYTIQQGDTCDGISAANSVSTCVLPTFTPLLKMTINPFHQQVPTRKDQRGLHRLHLLQPPSRSSNLYWL